ncbi:MAG TPA: GNAT family N-acetyltransferase [Caldimonas sp.]|jgi:GNAT superfamily N-acetyltransferase|nr:GNAT family N-acetyltransferase [Caldimonas sp.]HEX2539652.1 GNAT family N-acetyltransferase [Caldimonas sp.]
MDDRRLSPLAADAVDDAGRVLGAAFLDDPVMRYYFEGDADRSMPVRATMTLAAALTVRHGVAWRLDVDAGLAGVALLLPPDVPDFPLAAVVAAVLRTPRLWRPRALRRHFGVTASVEAHRPAFPCWTLLSIGVEPASQRRGHGAWLLARVLDGLPAGATVCLETDHERNLPLYRRHGFAVTSEFLADAGRGPLTWSMRRPGASHHGA